MKAALPRDVSLNILFVIDTSGSISDDDLNTNGAQLIFTTHDVTLLDQDLVRKDQVWITEKNQEGSTDLYSLQDFEGLREDTPFEKWYLAGKFGGLPQIKNLKKTIKRLTI